MGESASQGEGDAPTNDERRTRSNRKKVLLDGMKQKWMDGIVHKTATFWG